MVPKSNLLAPRFTGLPPLPPRAGLMDHQHPAGKAHPLQSGDRSLGLGSMGHRDEAKAWRLASLPILENIAASHYPIEREQLAELVCSRRRRKVTDKNPHGCLLRFAVRVFRIHTFRYCWPTPKCR